MASGLQNFAEMEFEGGGSQSQAMTYTVMVAQVVGQVTGDEQLLAIAQGLGQQQQPEQPQPGIMAGAQ